MGTIQKGIQHISGGGQNQLLAKPVLAITLEIHNNKGPVHF